MEIWITILGYLLAPVTGVVSWIAASRKRKNDFLTDLQASIDLLSAKNKELINEVVNLRGEVVQLKSENTALRREIEELNERLSNVKTITKTKKE